ncbi:hypothetical protein JRO89_XS07G0162200 [Xanthoceras sorbifolium]|uniref:Uncharacterized protein n=1 Tax=Xanthoceras sorbifolium TaxID=99658 RepID=A0ABQ8HU29_9ROSI|nr:hypothetical protein JRO89_XS07G0162200 [Xanthoceras sorbifolium]
MDLSELWAIFGPGVAGAVFGAGWWFWIDAVVCSYVKVSFLHYLPGIFASLAALMFNCVRKEDIDYSPYEEGEWRLKLWLFLAYVVSFVSLAASVGLLIQDSLVKTGPSVWTGTAGVLQCNEAIPGPNANYIGQAITNIHQAIGFTNILVISAGAFNNEAVTAMQNVVQSAYTGSVPVMVNVYPYCAYSGDTDHVSLDCD